MNPLFNELNKTPGFNPAQMMQSITEFRKNFKGDPKQQVQQLLNSGAMTQAQFNQLSQQAQQIMQMLPIGQS